MAKDTEFEATKVGTIPDVFHDILAYIVPGCAAIILFACDLWIVDTLDASSVGRVLGDDGLAALTKFSLFTIVAYVTGRFFEQLGCMTIHHRSFPFFRKMPSPQWSLIFDEEKIKRGYTKAFKDNVSKKIEKWLAKQDGTALVTECKTGRKTDYFNLIKFYMQERFPSIALYDKKQNANIVLNRSLALVFFCNIVICLPLLWQTFTLPEELKTADSLSVIKWFAGNVSFIWLVGNALFAFVLYKRFRQDQRYHAEYIFETFIATKRLVKSKRRLASRDATNVANS